MGNEKEPMQCDNQSHYIEVAQGGVSSIQKKIMNKILLNFLTRTLQYFQKLFSQENMKKPILKVVHKRPQIFFSIP